MASASAWAQRLIEFLPDLAAGDDALSSLRGRWSVLLHGSTAAGVDDAVSDLDLWALVPVAALAEHDRRSASRFHAFSLDGKKGHLNVESGSDFQDRLARCDMPLLAELRRAQVLEDGLGAGRGLVAAARRPMPQAVRHAWFRFHYGEMRGWWRTAENAAGRADATALLLTAPRVLEEAMRAAMILDGEPYPYQKWLPAWSAAVPTGSLLVPARERFLDALGAGGLRGGEAGEAMAAALLEIRRILIERAREERIEGDWLERWWLDINGARAAIAEARWPTAPA
ncbi:MAG TPA: DUF4037 domain-containing protein [Candidatus Dormibacteraeota bacterium]|jgi:hypothetical protein|nr:DUF4037 domain-containing protein [Candidatus Dormibacteraeota bacterium]